MLKSSLVLKSCLRDILDVVDEDKGYIVEYKTSSKDMIKPEYKLQLGVYALLFKDRFNKLPEKMFINFLKHDEKEVPVTSEVLNEAKRICKLVKLKTLSRDIKDYPCKKSALCRWGSRECGV